MSPVFDRRFVTRVGRAVVALRVVVDFRRHMGMCNFVVHY